MSRSAWLCEHNHYRSMSMSDHRSLKPRDKRRSPADDVLRYPARSGYLSESMVTDYEAARYSGLLGRWRHRREQSGVERILNHLPKDLVLLDCPCGIGRWWPVLVQYSSEIKALDISPAMVEKAKKAGDELEIPVSVRLGDAEAIDLPDDAVDVVFSHALTKHLPIPVQYRVLSEYSRVSRHWVVCSFSLVSHISYEFWRRRSFLDSYPLLPEQLVDMTKAASLSEVARYRCSTPIGVEHTVLLKVDQK